MNLSLLAFPVIVPLLFWASYHYYHDRHRPEPLLNLAACVALGAAAAYLNRYMYLGLDFLGLRYDARLLATESLSGLLAYAVLVIGLGEELAKMLPFLLVAIRFKAFDEPLDAIIYVSFIALGFALVENLHYAAFLPPGEATARGFAGPLVHMTFAAIWAYPVGLAKLKRRPVVLAAAGWLTISALAHGLYDFVVLGFGVRLLPLAALSIATLWIWRLLLIRRLQLTADSGTQ